MDSVILKMSPEDSMMVGWSSSDVGETYGEGFQLSNVNIWMKEILLG